MNFKTLFSESLNELSISDSSTPNSKVTVSNDIFVLFDWTSLPQLLWLPEYTSAAASFKVSTVAEHSCLIVR